MSTKRGPFLKASVGAAPCLSITGFSLIETMVVMAIIALLSTLTLLSVSVITGSHLAKAVDTIDGATVVARQRAISSSSYVALVTTPASSGTTSSGQALLLVSAKLNASGVMQWNATDAWVLLPPDIQITTSSFYAPGGSSLSGNLPLNLSGTPVSNYAYIIFCPDGSVEAPTLGPTINLRRSNKSTSNADYTIIVQQDSGRAKVVGD